MRSALPRPSDWVSSIVVFVVALPLSLGIALASGAPPSTGIITAIVGGIVGGLLAGAPLVVSGPAAGLTAIVFEMIQKHGLQQLCVITVFAGLIQILAGTLRLGKWVAYIPTVVLEGVLSAIGLIIAVDQLYVLWGDSVPKTIGLALTGVVGAFFRMLHEPRQIPILLCGAVAIGTKLLWARLRRTRTSKILALVPPSLPAVIVASLLSLAWRMPRVAIAELFSQMLASSHQFMSLEWTRGPLTPFLVPALVIAAVASAESLLTARGVDVLAKDDPIHRPANLDRELIAQGAANSVSGMVGGLPVTAVMVRSSVNVSSGARSQWSAVFHGIWLCVFVALFPIVLTKIPLTALAAILIVTGFRLFNLGGIRHALRTHPLDGMLWLTTILAIILTDLLTGLGISLGLALVVRYRSAIARACGAKGITG